MATTVTFDYRALADKSHLVYIGILGLLVYVLLFGTVQMGAKRWISLHLFNLQPSEFAKVGVVVALGLYLFVILRALEAARLAKDRLGSYLVLGVLASFTFQVIYNITMSAGLAPVKGLTLPLMSYGGSSMIATLAGFGLVLNVRMRRFTN